jgi:signal transduction protein with GAF and PtsI domain
MLQRPDSGPESAESLGTVIRLNSVRQGAWGETPPSAAKLLHTLSDLSSGASAVQNRAQLASLVVQSACHVLAADSAALYLWEEPSTQLRLAYSSDGPDNVDPHIAPDESLAGQVFAQQEPMLISDYSTWRKEARSFEPVGFRSAAAVPLATQQRAIGALVVRFRSAVEDPSVLDLLSLLSMIASAPLEAAELRQRLQREEKFDGALRRMTQALAAHENEGRVLWLAVRYAAQLLSSPFARLWLLEPDGSFVCAAAEGYLEPDPIGLRMPPDCVAGLVINTGPVNLTDALAHPAWCPVPRGRASWSTGLHQRADAASGQISGRAVGHARSTVQACGGTPDYDARRCVGRGGRQCPGDRPLPVARARPRRK